jgi:hypothetical protein
MMPVIHLEELRTERHGGKCGEGKRRAAGKTMDGTQGNLLYAINHKGNVNIPAYGNVEHQGTAIVSEISIKWGRRPIFRESLRPRYNRPPLGREML